MMNVAEITILQKNNDFLHEDAGGPARCGAPVPILWVGRRLVLQRLRDDNSL